MHYLAFNLNDGNEFIFDIVEDRLSLGRDAGNEIVIDNSYISSFHAKLVRQADDSYEVNDLKSANGTFINGKRIERGILKIGDRIRFGQLDARLRDATRPDPENTSKVATTSASDMNDRTASAGSVTTKLKKRDASQSAIPASSGDQLKHDQAKAALALELTKLESEIARKQNEFKELESRHAAMEKVMADQVERGSAQEAQTKTLSKQHAKLERCQSKLQTAVDEKSTQLESLSASHDALKDSIAQLTLEEAALKESIVEQTALAKSLEQSLAPSREELQRTESALAEARAALETLSQIHADDAAARSSLQEAITRRETEETRAAQLTTENAETQKLLEVARSQLARLHEQQSEHEDLRKNLTEQISEHQTRFATAAAATEGAELKLAELQAGLQTHEGTISTQLEELTRRVDDLRREEDGLATSLQASRERLQRNEAAYQELEKKLVEKELTFSQFTHSGDKLVSLSEALSQMETREQEVSRHLQEVAEQELSTQVKLNSLDAEITREQQRLEQVRREREHEEQEHRKMVDGCASELDAARRNLAEQMKREESALALRLKERVQALEEKHEMLRQNLSASMDEKTVIVFAGDLIKRIDLVDILIQRFSGSSANAALDQQLRTLRASLEDILAQHSISEFTVAPGAEVDVDLRLRITIVESIAGPARPKVIDSFRPGFVYTAEDGREVILRKVEVKTSSA